MQDRARYAETVGIVHFTGPPAIGGVEALVEAQCRALADLGCTARPIVGTGAVRPAVQPMLIPEMLPSNPSVQDAKAALYGQMPARDHPLVALLATRLRTALQGCSQCWIHNALTVNLHPFLTVALTALIGKMTAMRWVAWCEDISAASTYVSMRHPDERAIFASALPRVTYVTISEARRRELSQTLSLPQEDIRVIPPPLDALAWLGAGEEARRIARSLDLETAPLVMLVPAKLLAHKNLGLVLRTTSHLVDLAPGAVVMLTAAPSPHEGDRSEDIRRTLREERRQLRLESTVHLLPDILGHVPSRETVRDLMSLSDLVFLPSIEEGFGMPLLEAFALRAPVLCSDIPPFREVGGSTARYFPPDADPGAIARQASEIAAWPSNVARRRSLVSTRRFIREIADLAHVDRSERSS